MAKTDRNDKRKKSKQDKVNKISAQLDSQIYASGSTYADGTPLDRVQYLEAKLILKPDHDLAIFESAPEGRFRIEVRGHSVARL